MSASSFHRHFKAVTGLSPLQYQKQIRLQEARQRLLGAPGDVTSVALAVGYESTSQFTREYGRLFGLPPAKDAARLRLANASWEPAGTTERARRSSDRAAGGRRPAAIPRRPTDRARPASLDSRSRRSP
jgi:AraC-like DNA-binding protein